MSDTATHLKQNYIGGQWVDSKGGKPHDVINPATEEAASTIVLGTAADVDDAVAAVREALEELVADATCATTPRPANRIVKEYKKRAPDLAKSMASEMGAPVSFAGTAQVGAGIGGFLGTIAALKDFNFTEKYAARHRLRTDRRRRHDHAVELAAQPDRAEGRSGARRGQHDGAETVGGMPRQATDLCRDPRRRGRAAGRVQPRAR